MWNLQTHYYFKLDFQNVGQHPIVSGTKHRKAISCKVWNSPVEYRGRESKNDTSTDWK